jgi:peptidoglycan-associated lipoprotein
MKLKILTVISTGLMLSAMSGCAHRAVKPDGEGAPTAQNPAPLSLQMTHFAFNRADLTDSGKAALKQDALALSSDPKVKIQARGYCDDRGSVEYNLALGERRAAAVKNYLVSLGIAADRIETVSFGKADPLNPGHNEQAWALNRRASFAVLNPSHQVAFR